VFIADDLHDAYTHKTFTRTRVSHHPSRHDRSSVIPRASSPSPSLTRARGEDSRPPPARVPSPVVVVFAPPKTWPRFDSHTVQPECARSPCARASSSSTSSTDTFISDTKIARPPRPRSMIDRARARRAPPPPPPRHRARAPHGCFFSPLVRSVPAVFSRSRRSSLSRARVSLRVLARGRVVSVATRSCHCYPRARRTSRDDVERSRARGPIARRPRDRGVG